MQTDSFCSISLRGEKFAHIYSGKRIYSFKWFLSVQLLRIWWRSLTVWSWINLAKDWQRRFNFCTLIRYIVFHLWRQKMLQRCQKTCFCNQLRYFRFGSIHNLLECRQQILLKEMACKRRSSVHHRSDKTVAFFLILCQNVRGFSTISWSKKKLVVTIDQKTCKRLLICGLECIPCPVFGLCCMYRFSFAVVLQQLVFWLSSNLQNSNLTYFS